MKDGQEVSVEYNIDMTREKIQAELLSRAIRYEQEGDTYQAASLYCDILLAEGHHTLKQVFDHPDGDSVLQQAYHGLMRMAASRDECTWEMASQVLGDLRATLME